MTEDCHRLPREAVVLNRWLKVAQLEQGLDQMDPEIPASLSPEQARKFL